MEENPDVATWPTYNVETRNGNHCGGNVHLLEHNNRSSQKWKWIPDEQAFVNFESNLALDVYNSGGEDGTNVQFLKGTPRVKGNAGFLFGLTTRWISWMFPMCE